MAGFFGLFGGKAKYVDEPTEVTQPQRQDAYYLEADDAKTLGNIEFMRKPNVIRRTFPKTAANQKGGESIRQISSMEAAKVKDNGIAAKSFESAKSSTPNNENSRRKEDDSLNPFLKMAREIKK